MIQTLRDFEINLGLFFFQTEKGFPYHFTYLQRKLKMYFKVKYLSVF